MSWEILDPLIRQLGRRTLAGIIEASTGVRIGGKNASTLQSWHSSGQIPNRKSKAVKAWQRFIKLNTKKKTKVTPVKVTVSGGYTSKKDKDAFGIAQGTTTATTDTFVVSIEGINVTDRDKTTYTSGTPEELADSLTADLIEVWGRHGIPTAPFASDPSDYEPDPNVWGAEFIEDDSGTIPASVVYGRSIRDRIDIDDRIDLAKRQTQGGYVYK